MLTTILLIDIDGRLDRIDVYCNDNSVPVPLIIDIRGGPAASRASKNLPVA
jgi:hypothetical protein